MEFTNQAGVDIILDPVGGAMAEINAEILARDGTWVLYGLLGGGSGRVFKIILVANQISKFVSQSESGF